MKRHTYSPEFKQEADSPVLDQGYSIAQACTSLGVGESAPGLDPARPSPSGAMSRNSVANQKSSYSTRTKATSMSVVSFVSESVGPVCSRVLVNSGTDGTMPRWNSYSKACNRNGYYPLAIEICSKQKECS